VSNPIIFYKSTFCPHSWSVERFLKSNDIPVKLINIDQNPLARQKVMELNNGFASVPTLVFPDGSQLTEPSFAQIRNKLGLEKPSLLANLKGFLSRN
jgi:mycoredoxin